MDLMGIKRALAHIIDIERHKLNFLILVNINCFAGFLKNVEDIIC